MPERLFHVVGNGVLATVMRAVLDLPLVSSNTAAGLTVIADDTIPLLPELSRAGVNGPFVRVFVDDHFLVLGPLNGVHGQGCDVCLVNRRNLIRPFASEWSELVRAGRAPRFGDHRRDPSAAVLAAALLNAIRLDPPATYRTIERATLATVTRSFLPDPLCERCGDIPIDEPAVLTMSPTPKSTPFGARGYASPALESLSEIFIDSYAGLSPAIEVGDERGVPVARAMIGIRGSNKRESGWGRSTSVEQSSSTAVLEAIERWCGLAPGRTHGTVFASAAELGGAAVDILQLGLPTDEPGRNDIFTKFTPNTRCRWVWGNSLLHSKPILIPEAYAYYGSHLLHSEDPRFAYEVSNGCALGSSLVEAITHGLLEVLERDAFLLTWYARLSVPRIDFSQANQTVKNLAAHISDRNDCRIIAFDIDQGMGVPTVWAMAIRDGVVWADGATGPASTVSAAAGGLTLDGAIEAALLELGPLLPSVDRAVTNQREKIDQMVGDSTKVLNMGEHSLYFAHPSTLRHLDFLDLTENPNVPIPVKPHAFEPDEKDLANDLAALAGRVAEQGLEVLVVDQTAADISPHNLFCVKVIVPGALPMTFGHANRRTVGFERLDKKLDGRGINPVPHPFP